MTHLELLHIRKSLGLTQTQIADLLGITLRGFQNYEYGHRKIPGPVDRLVRIIDKLGIQLLKEL